MATLSAQVETTLNERSAQKTAGSLESMMERAERFTPRMSGGEGISDQLSSRVSTGLTEGIEDSLDTVKGLRDAMGQGISGGAKTAVQSRRSDRRTGASAGAGAMAGGAMGAMKSHPALAALGAIAGSTALLARASPTFGAIFDILSTMKTVVLQPIGQMIGDSLMPFAMSGMDMAMNFNRMVSEDGLSVALGAVVVDSIRRLPGFLMDLNAIAMSLPFEILSGMMSVIEGALRAIGLDGAADFYADSAEFYSDLASGIRSLPEMIRSAVADPIGTLKNPIDSIPDGLRDTLGPAFNGVYSSIESAIGAVPGISRPNLPRLATGGIVTGATTAMIGEGRESEAVLPLSRLEGMLNVDRDIEVEVDVDLDDSELSSQLDELIRIGRKLLDKDPVEIERSRFDGARR